MVVTLGKAQTARLENAEMLYSLNAWQHLGSYHNTHGQQIFVIDSQKDRDEPPLLLLHGYPRSSWDYSLLFNKLAQSHRVIAPDFLGFGFSSKPYPHQYSIIQQANIVEAILAQKNISQCHVITHNYGDAVVLELLARQNTLCHKQFISATFLGSSLYDDAQTPTLVQRALSTSLGPFLVRAMGKDILMRSFASLFGPHTKPTSQQLHTAWQLVSHDAGVRCLPAVLAYFKERRTYKEKWAAALAESEIPMALIRGTADPVAHKKTLYRFRALQKTHSFVFELPNIGHYPHLESPHETLNAWQYFLDRCHFD